MVSYSDTIRRTRKKLLGNTNIRTFDRGSIIRELVEAFTRESLTAYDILKTFALESYVTESSGERLNQLGLLVGVPRGTDKVAYGQVTFYIKTELGEDFNSVKQTLVDNGVIGAADDVILPTGTTVSDESDEAVFTTTEDVTLSSEDAVVPIVATVSGSAGNAGAGQITKFTPPSAAYDAVVPFIGVKNVLAIDTGEETETDDNYRYRIINSFSSHAKANETAVRISALSVPGVSDVYIKNYENGIGTFSVYVISESPVVSEGITSAVQEVVNQTAAMGIRAVVQSPNYEAVHMDIKVQFKQGTTAGEKTRATNDMSSVIVNYINNLVLGEEIIVNSIIALIFEQFPSVRNADIVLFGRGEYDITDGIIKNYKPLILNNQTIDFNTKWVTNKKLITICEA